MKKYIKGVLLFLVLFGLDQWSKYAADTCLQGHEAKKVIGDVFVLQYLKNYGAAFGILQNKQIFLVILTAVILAAIIYIDQNTGYGTLSACTFFWNYAGGRGSWQYV